MSCDRNLNLRVLNFEVRSKFAHFVNVKWFISRLLLNSNNFHNLCVLIIFDSTQFLSANISNIKFTAHKKCDKYIDVDTQNNRRLFIAQPNSTSKYFKISNALQMCSTFRSKQILTADISKINFFSTTVFTNVTNISTCT